MRANWALLIIVGLVFASVGTTVYLVTHQGPSVGLYCTYGAVSEAQLDQCISEVQPEDFAHSRTHAALYGRGLLDACLDDAGPFCEGTQATTPTSDSPPVDPHADNDGDGIPDDVLDGIWRDQEKQKDAINDAIEKNGGWTIGG